MKKSKTDLRYWEDRIEKRRLPNGDLSPDYSVRIAHVDKAGISKRERFNLGSPNKSIASRKAQEIFLHLSVNGWPETISKFKGEKAKPKDLLTVGQWVSFASKASGSRRQTFNAYESALCRIVTDLFQISRPVGKKSASRSPEFQRWKEKVDGIKLSELTASKLEGWARDFIADRSETPRSAEIARTSARSILANAKGLFSMNVIKAASRTEGLIIPDPIPFAGVELPKVDRARMRYKSKVDLPSLFERAEVDLSEEEMKVFVLAIACGLRRGEIDSLLWDQVDFNWGLIRVERTEFADLKSSSSSGEIPLDLEILAMFRGWFAKRDSDFVLPGRKPNLSARHRTYRADSTFKSLIEWLRDQGVTARKPIHELRKEAGRLMTESHGIFAASRFLRHADVKTTAAHYADDSRRLTTGVGALFKGSPTG